VMPFEMHCMST